MGRETDWEQQPGSRTGALTTRRPPLPASLSPPSVPSVAKCSQIHPFPSPAKHSPRFPAWNLRPSQLCPS